MHCTKVVLKDGRTFDMPIEQWNPEEGWFKLFDVDEKIWFKDLVSAVTPNERIGYGKIGDDDLLEKARRYMREGREHGWGKLTKDTPKQEWE
jgi:hypothetical protein